ncbi:MAG TPA: F0F1 ATP synthase subunit gamma [Chthonomonadaceae bacterium]|nr:F0F1 ATP synthase subunit gamma [Chthonomonadaceae bacterium]
MTQTTDKLRRKIRSAAEIKSVVRTMKNWAAVNIRPYEQAVQSLTDYYRTVELGLIACLRQFGPELLDHRKRYISRPVGVVVFGSDQGMVGQFNEQLADFVLEELKAETEEIRVWPVGERVCSHWMGSRLQLEPAQRVPDSVLNIAPLIGQVLFAIEQQRAKGNLGQVFLFHNRPLPGSGYLPVRQCLLPFDQVWAQDLRSKTWPTAVLPQVREPAEATFAALVREYLFISLFRACAESLASENACRLAAMQGAEDNIKKLQTQLQADFNQTRQNGIDEELFDVIAGVEAVNQTA